MQRNYVNMLIILVNYFILIYSSTFIEEMGNERVSEREKIKN